MSQENDSNTLCMWFAWGCRIHGFTNKANHVRVGWLRGHKGDLFLYSHDPKEHLNVQMQRTPKTKSAKQESKEHDMWRQFEVTVGHGLVTGRFGSFPFHFNWGVSHRSRLVTGWSRGPGLIFKQNMLQTVLSMYFGLFAKVHEVHEWNGTKTKTM